MKMHNYANTHFLPLCWRVRDSFTFIIIKSIPLANHMSYHRRATQEYRSEIRWWKKFWFVVIVMIFFVFHLFSTMFLFWIDFVSREDTALQTNKKFESNVNVARCKQSFPRKQWTFMQFYSTPQCGAWELFSTLE